MSTDFASFHFVFVDDCAEANHVWRTILKMSCAPNRPIFLGPFVSHIEGFVVEL